MKRSNKKKSGFSIGGAIGFFALVAIIIQIAILVYDHIIDRPEIDKADDKGLIALLMLIVILALAAVCTVIDIIRRKIMIDRPVERILSATEQIAAGNFNVRLTPAHAYGKYNEFDTIMENLNIAAAELSKSEILKTDFISNVSHELKTPLAVIQNYATLLQETDQDEEARQRYAKTLVEAAHRLTDLITDILKLNRLENREIQPEYEIFDLTEVLAQAILQYEDPIEAKRLKLQCDLDEVTIRSSKSYLDVILNNLLSNAVKFTEAGGTIGITLKKHGETAVITVSDTGCGISPENGARIFEKFYQGDTSHASEGNGLGLALVKKVIDLLGGEISVKSETGKGSTFTVALKGVMTDE